MDLGRYLVDTNGIGSDALLDDWRWLLGDRPFAVFRATAMGDLFLRDEPGQFYFLDMVGGKLRPLASEEPELWAVLSDRSARKELLLTHVVRELQEAGFSLAPGECYSPELPPVVGGDLSPENLKPCDLRVHASILGQLHRQAKDLPHGTRIRAFISEE